jgi:general secretion pathway protein D
MWPVRPATADVRRKPDFVGGSTCSNANRCGGYCVKNRYSLENETSLVKSGFLIHRQSLAVLMALTGLSLPVYADRGNDAYKQGVRAERLGDYDAASGYYKQASTLTPNNPKYLSAYTRIRFNAAEQHVHTGQLLRNTGVLTEALAQFQRAVEIDSSSFIAQQELRRTVDMIRRQERQRLAPKVESPLAKLADDVGESVELQPLSNAAITLHLTVNADTAYKTIGKLAGINVAIDPDYRPQKITVDLTDVTLREALELVRLESKTFWRPVLPNTIFVAADSPAKRKELEQNVMKTFYLRNITTPNELQEAANLVRQMLDVSRVQLIQAQDALVLLGTPDQMVLAEKLLADIDKPKSEVIIDVAVMQVSRTRLNTLGTVVPTSTSIGYLPGISGGSTPTGSGGAVKIGDFAVSVPGASFTFLASDSNTKLLQNPEIRALNNEKSTLKIGDRVPIATGSFQPGIVGAGGVSPLVSTQFQYLDVGVNIDITPHIHSDNEVTLKMVLEISSVTGSQDIGGITQPIIGQRRIEHETRLADGDVNLLGGILEQNETQSLSGYPWISKLPILKYLFAQDNKQRTENEIIFAITPHIVRAKEVTEENLRVVDVGTGSLTELRRKPSATAASAPDHPNVDPAKPQQPAAQGSPRGVPGPTRPSAPSQPSSQNTGPR